MATKNQIINFALSHIGSKQYTDAELNSATNNTPAVRQGRLWVDQARDEVLSAYPWTFATVRKALVAKVFTSVQSPSYESDWTNAYQYPCDCIQMQYIVDPTIVSPTELITNTPYAIEANPDSAPTEERRLLLCNVADATAVYTTNGLEYEDIPPHFVQPLSILLASHIAFAVTSDLELKASLIRLYASSLGSYTSQDANQIQNKQPQESEAIRARFIG